MTSSNPKHLPKAPPPNTISLGVRASTYEFGGTHSVHSPISLANEWFRHGPFSLPKEDGRKTRALYFLYLGPLALGPPLAVRTRPHRGQSQEHHSTGNYNPDFPIYRQAFPFRSSICLTPDLPQSAVEKRKRVMGQGGLYVTWSLSQKPLI